MEHRRIEKKNIVRCDVRRMFRFICICTKHQWLMIVVLMRVHFSVTSLFSQYGLNCSSTFGFEHKYFGRIKHVLIRFVANSLNELCTGFFVFKFKQMSELPQNQDQWKRSYKNGCDWLINNRLLFIHRKKIKSHWKRYALWHSIETSS